MSPPSRQRLALSLLLLFPAVLALVTLFRPPAPNHDFIGSMRAWDWWRAGGSFHHYPLPPPLGDAAARPEAFLGWWSPGTYLPPAAFELLGLALPLGIALWLALGTALGLAGWRRLWRDFGFDDTTALVSAALVATSWHVLYSFRIYHGGEIARFALVPWLWLGLRALPAGSRPQALALFLATLCAAFAKLSLVITLAGIGLHLAWESPRRLAAFLRLGGAGAAGVAAIWLGCLSGAANPGDGHGTALPADLAVRLGMAWNLPAGSLFCLTSAAGRFGDAWLHGLRPETSAWWLAACVAAAGAVYAAAWRYSAGASHRRALLAVGGVTVLGLASLFLRDAAVSYEDRHARDAALLVLPAVVACALRASPPARVLLSAGLLFSSLWGLASLGNFWLLPAPPVGPRGLALLELPAEVASRARDLVADSPPGSAVVVSPAMELSLHLPAARVFTPEDLGPAPETRLRAARLLVYPESDWRRVRKALPASETDRWMEETAQGWTLLRAR